MMGGAMAEDGSPFGFQLLDNRLLFGSALKRIFVIKLNNMKRTATLLSVLCVALAGSAQITDGSFEAGIGAGTWTESSVIFGTPLCDASCGDCGGPCGPNTGDIYAWFGGSGDATELGSLEQDAVIPTGTVVALVAAVKIGGAGDGTDGNYVKAFVDGNEVGVVTALDSADFVEYTQVIILIDAFADGGTHTIRIEGKENGTTAFNGLVDDVGIAVDGQVIIGLFENESLQRVSLVPNPANEQATLNFNALKGAATVTLADLAGQVYSSETLNEVYQRSFSMDTRALANGAYIVSVVKDGATFQQRLVVTH